MLITVPFALFSILVRNQSLNVFSTLAVAERAEKS
jgi:hypothetical protein